MIVPIDGFVFRTSGTYDSNYRVTWDDVSGLLIERIDSETEDVLESLRVYGEHAIEFGRAFNEFTSTVFVKDV